MADLAIRNKLGIDKKKFPSKHSILILNEKFLIIMIIINFDIQNYDISPNEVNVHILLIKEQ